MGDSVTKVAVSSRLTDAPACITAAGPVSLEMERIMAQMPDGGDAIKSERVLEVNAKHAVFDVLRAAQEAGDADKVKLYAELLYNQALLVEGLPIEDPVAYANAVAEADGVIGSGGLPAAGTARRCGPLRHPRLRAIPEARVPRYLPTGTSCGTLACRDPTNARHRSGPRLYYANRGAHYASCGRIDGSLRSRLSS